MRLIVATALAAGLGLAGASPAAAQRAGSYGVQGTNADGSTYAGTLSLAQDGASSWRVRWQVGGEAIDGVGMSAGNILTAAYTLNSRVGLVIYQIMPDGRMSGQWTLQGSRGVGTETLTPR